MALLSSLIAVALGSHLGARPRFVVLAVGIQGYDNAVTGFPALHGPNDVKAFMTALSEFYGFDESKGDVQRVLTTDGTTTRKGIMDGLAWLSSTARPGDAAVFYYSGHGTRVPDASKPNGYSQAIVPIDVRRRDGKPSGGVLRDTVITGPDIGKVLASLEAKGMDNVTLIFDSCHSESISRGSLISKAGLPNPDPPAVPRGGLDPTEPGWTLGKSLAVLSGASQDGMAYEDKTEKKGVFTLALVDAMRQIYKGNRRGVAYGDFFDRVRSRAQFRASIQGYTQVPKFEGNASRILFGTETVPQMPFYRLAVSGTSVRVMAGAVHGIAEGFLFGIYKAGSDMQGAPDLFGEATSTMDEATTLLKLIDKGGNRVNPALETLVGARAVLEDGQPSGTTRLLVDGDQDPDCLTAIYSIPTARKGEVDAYDLRLSPPGASPEDVVRTSTGSDKWLLTDSRKVEIASFSGRIEEIIKEPLRKEVLRNSKRLAVLNIAPRDRSAVPVEFELVQVRVRRNQSQPGGSEVEVPVEIIRRGDSISAGVSLALRTVPSGKETDQRFALRARVPVQEGQTAAYAPTLCVLDLTANGQVKQLWPYIRPGQMEVDGNKSKLVLPANGKWYYLGNQNDLVSVSDKPTEAELARLTCYNVDRVNDGQGVETLKLFATSTYQSFSMLWVEGARGGPASRSSSNALDKLLTDIANADPRTALTRGQVRSGPPANWSVASVQLLVDMEAK